MYVDPLVIWVVAQKTEDRFVKQFSLLHQSCRCMLNTIDGPSESVEDYLCDPEEMPLGARESRLPCPEDCVLNDWGPWSRCSLVRPEPRLEHISASVCIYRSCRHVWSPHIFFILRGSWNSKQKMLCVILSWLHARYICAWGRRCICVCVNGQRFFVHERRGKEVRYICITHREAELMQYVTYIAPYCQFSQRDESSSMNKKKEVRLIHRRQINITLPLWQQQ